MIPDESVTAPARAQWESFLPALQAALDADDGPVLEVGIGHYSTPWLNQRCREEGRLLVSVEHNLDWYMQFAAVYRKSDCHVFLHGAYGDTISLLAAQRWGVVLLDHSPGERRGQDMETLLMVSKFILIHDYHAAIEEAVKPMLAGVNWHVCRTTTPPTLVVSALRYIPDSILAL